MALVEGWIFSLTDSVKGRASVALWAKSARGWHRRHRGAGSMSVKHRREGKPSYRLSKKKKLKSRRTESRKICWRSCGVGGHT